MEVFCIDINNSTSFFFICIATHQYDMLYFTFRTRPQKITLKFNCLKFHLFVKLVKSHLSLLRGEKKKLKCIS